MTTYRFLAEAEAEYLDAVRFYEELKAGLGASLIADFERAIALLLNKPESRKLVHPSGIRRIDLSRFPYAILYRVQFGQIEITAFAHHRRRPRY